MLLRNNKVTLATPSTSSKPRRKSIAKEVLETPTSEPQAYRQCPWLEEYESLPPIEETLLDVHPGSLDEPFYWCYRTGQSCWVKVSNVDTIDCVHRWQVGKIDDVIEWVVCEQGVLPQCTVGTIVNGERVQFTISPGLQPNLLPDTPQVRDLLRRYGYDP